MTHDPRAVPHIQLSGISKAYPNGVQALQNINLTLYQGEIFGIIGARRWEIDAVASV